jgi:hypothetical protein
MSRFASTARLLAGSAVLFAAAALVAGAAAQTPPSPPDFSSNGVGWQTANGGDFIPVAGSPRPTTNDPAHPYVSNATARRTGQQPNYRISDIANPNLKQWAKDVMKKDNDEVLAGKIAYTAGQSCKPYGVPALWLSGGPFFFVQTPKEVLIIEEGDRLARHIYMNVPHSAKPKPSWYGESVGHYEGDTLVVDTIGMNNKTFVDNYRTPHTEKLHVVERWRTIDGGKTLEVHMTVEDPDTFNQPWQVIRRFGREESELGENICQEGNFVLFDYGIPVASKPDF